MTLNRRHILFVILAISAVLTLTATAADKPTVVLGRTSGDAAKRNAEFRRYSRLMPLYKEHDIQASLFERDGLMRQDWTEEQLLETFRRYHVIHFGTSMEGVHQLDEAFRRRAPIVGRALARYAEEGGGILIQPTPERYPGSDDEEYWNLVLAPLGLQILHEGIADTTRMFEKQSFGNSFFWFTRNFAPHPVTEGVSGLCLPRHGFGSLPGVVAMAYDEEWSIPVRGEAEARSYLTSATDNVFATETPGTYASAPPVLAVRPFGKGRIACLPVSQIYTGINYGNPLWPQIVESRGDLDSGRPGDLMRLLMNTYRWLGEPALDNPTLGTHRPEPYKPATFPESIAWSDRQLLPTPEQIANASYVRAVVGAHSSHTDGKGTVADYAAAAKAAGVSVVVFTDPLEQLTPESFAALKADCAAASEAGDFYACPGVEFTDGAGIRWAFWGEKVVFPEESFKNKNRTYVQWDGQRVRHYGRYAAMCGFPGSAVLSYEQLRAQGAHPENQWWFFHYLPLVYDHGKLVAENYRDYLFGLRDMRWAALMSFTRITDPAAVADAAALCHTAFNSLPNAREALNTRCNAYGEMNAANQQVSQGPLVVSWTAANSQRAGNTRRIRGVQRIRLAFAVRSDAGIAEVRVHDADRGLIRRFLGHGAKQFAREFELVHDQQRYPTLEVVDTEGRRAFSRHIWVFCYKSQLFRCGDNLNILGPTAMCWHPDRNEIFTAAKDFRNGTDFHLVGWDTSSSTLGVPTPQSWLQYLIRIADGAGNQTGEYPHRSTLGAMPSRMMTVNVNASDLQVATMNMTHLAEIYETEDRPQPAMGSLPRDVGEIEFYERTHTIYAPMARVDMFVAWDHRREREGRQDYRGGIIWHEGSYRFKKDVVLRGNSPIDLYREVFPVDVTRGIGTTFMVTDADAGTRVLFAREPEDRLRTSGRLEPGGYAAVMPYPVGYRALLAPAGSDFTYELSLGERGDLRVGMGQGGQEIKAGTVLDYRFGVATVADSEARGNDGLEHLVAAMNMDGERDGYPIEMAVGDVVDATFFFTAKAVAGETLFTLGPQSLLIDLPVRVRGLQDNGCAAVYTTALPRFRYIPVDANGTAWFTEPIDRANELWVGNVFVCDRPEIKLTLVIDGQDDGAPPRLAVHNPTDTPISATLTSPEHTPTFSGARAAVHVPAGDSLWLVWQNGKLQPEGN